MPRRDSKGLEKPGERLCVSKGLAPRQTESGSCRTSQLPPALALRLQSTRPVGRVSGRCRIGSLAALARIPKKRLPSSRNVDAVRRVIEL
jgi:hypothetical protein